MLRSAKRINITHPTFQNYEGYILAPVIQIYGIILRSDQVIPQAVLNFLIGKGARISILTLNTEKFICIQGVFSLSKYEVDAFLATNPQILAIQQAITDPLPTATLTKAAWESRFGSEIGSRLGGGRPSVGKSESEFFSDGSKIIEVKSPEYVGRDGVVMRAVSGSINNRGGKYLSTGDNEFQAARNVDIDGGKLEGFKIRRVIIANIAGQTVPVSLDTSISELSGLNVGLFGMYFASRTQKFSAQRATVIRNSAVTSGEELSFEHSIAGNLCLEIDRTVDWLNNPHSGDPDFKSYDHAQGTVKQIPRPS